MNNVLMNSKQRYNLKFTSLIRGAKKRAPVLSALCLVLKVTVLNGRIMLMKFRMYLALATLLCSTASIADEVGDLRGMARVSEDHKELTIDCLIEMRISKGNGWESEECSKYKHFSANELQEFKSKIKMTTSAFKEYSKSGDVSIKRIKRGLKQLIIIQENMKSIGGLSAKIKTGSKF